MKQQEMPGAAMSVQQIKFECISYIKEFGALAAEWTAGTCDAPHASMQAIGVDLEQDIWLCKPALTIRAANTVANFLHQRLGVRAGTHELIAEGRFVFLCRKVVAS